MRKLHIALAALFLSITTSYAHAWPWGSFLSKKQSEKIEKAENNIEQIENEESKNIKNNDESDAIEEENEEEMNENDEQKESAVRQKARQASKYLTNKWAAFKRGTKNLWNKAKKKIGSNNDPHEDELEEEENINQ